MYSKKIVGVLDPLGNDHWNHQKGGLQVDSIADVVPPFSDGTLVYNHKIATSSIYIYHRSKWHWSQKPWVYGRYIYI
jgi:hypothetical protein